ncbi:MAG: hypothetical protein EA403_08780 [Spirochaetaceae bacterium]|nr:MAG: hypothetical protein EA403_08780 [Spirochaetaceae bacterium]
MVFVRWTGQSGVCPARIPTDQPAAGGVGRHGARDRREPPRPRRKHRSRDRAPRASDRAGDALEFLADAGIRRRSATGGTAMKTVLCYGDSNTWGWNAATRARYPREERWTGRLQQQLGEGYWVVEEGQNGRTTVHDDPVEGSKNGMNYLIPCLESHHPVDLVVLMLGTNDLKRRFCKSAMEIARSAGRLVRAIRTSPFGPGDQPPRVLLVAPPPITTLTDFSEVFAGSVEKSLQFGTWYRAEAELHGVAFLDAVRDVLA